MVCSWHAETTLWVILYDLVSLLFSFTRVKH